MNSQDVVIGGAIICALIAGAFLTYTLRHLSELRISLVHPRVLVEASLMLVFAAAGAVLLARR